MDNAYLTVDRFRTMYTGNDLSALSDVQIRSAIGRASAKVDSFCAVSMIPTKHDFRGGVVKGEQHDWPLPDLTVIATPGARRVYFYHRPILSLQQFVVKFTNTYQVTVDPANIYVNRSSGWAEVVSIAAIVSGVYPVGINFGLYTPVVEVDYTYRWQFSETGEVLDETDERLFRAQNQFWMTSPAPVIYKNGTPVSTGLTIDYQEGAVRFDTELLVTDVVSADYSYTLPPAIQQATAIQTSEELVDASLIAKGMGGLQSLKVAEVELTKVYTGRRGAGANPSAPVIDPRAAELLEPFTVDTVRG